MGARAVQVRFNSGLSVITLASIQNLQELRIHANSAMVSFELPKFRGGGNFNLQVSAMSAVSGFVLTNLGSAAIFNITAIGGLANMEHMNIPLSTVSGAFSVNYNPQIMGIDMP